MSVEHEVSKHYDHGGLIKAIEAALARSGIERDAVTIADLAPVDEFHIGGRAATMDLAGPLALNSSDRILDVGCGSGGTARFFADQFGCSITGIDLTAEYVQTACTLSSWVGLSGHNVFERASALAMPFDNASFDVAYMLHVGMNIEAKSELFTEIARVLTAGGRFAVYDVMRTGDGDIIYPVPWATNGETSFLASPGEYRSALADGGLILTEEKNQRDSALEFFRKLRAKAASADGLPPLGTHILMGEGAGQKVSNMLQCISDGIIAPVQIIAKKPG